MERYPITEKDKELIEIGLQVLKENFDAVLVSNGPGNPEDAVVAINTVKELLGKVRLYGVCLGHLIISLALGAKTYKLK